MRTMLVLAIAMLAIGAPASAVNLLINGGFETWDGSNFAGWTKNMGTGTVQTLSQQAQDPLDNWGEGSYYGQSGKTYYSKGVATATLTQQVNLTPGTYNLALTGKLQRVVLDTSYVNHPTWGFFTVDFFVDGVNKYTVTYAANNVTESPAYNYLGFVSASVKVVLTMGDTGVGNLSNNKSFDLSKFDAFAVDLVPEPGSALAILTAMIGLGGLARRRSR